MWFLEAEASFRRARITSQQTMFDCVLEKFPGDIVISIRDLLLSIGPSTEGPYDRVKARLVTDFAPSIWQGEENILNRPDYSPVKRDYSE